MGNHERHVQCTTGLLVRSGTAVRCRHRSTVLRDDDQGGAEHALFCSLSTTNIPRRYQGGRNPMLSPTPGSQASTGSERAFIVSR
jgi:hypothetical protein